MASTNGTSHGDFDDRLAEALQVALIEGEEVIAQEVGDQGQAIVLTGSRIIILKAGLAATGELNGHRASAFAFGSITAINLRKGPLGAVIQVCAEDAPAVPEGPKPDHVVVFTGPGRVKKAEAFAASIESASGKPVNRVDPRPEADRPADKPIIEEVAATVPSAQVLEAVEAAPVVEQTPAVTPEPVAKAAVLEVEKYEEEEPAPHVARKPNPFLPKPVRKHESGPNRLLVALGVLAALVFVGMAVMAPLRDAQTGTAFPIAPRIGSGELNNVRLQLAAVTNYSSDVRHALGKADADADSLRAMIRAGNKAAIRSASRSSATDRALQKLSDLSAPPGLAEAKENISSGLMVRKNAITAAATAAASSAPMDVRKTSSRFDEADAQISKGLAAIGAALEAVEKQAAALAKRAKDGRGRH